MLRWEEMFWNNQIFSNLKLLVLFIRSILFLPENLPQFWFREILSVFAIIDHKAVLA